MTRSLLVLLVTLGVSSCALEAPVEPPALSRPNVLLMIADDQGWADLSCVGIADDVQTPALDALASNGLRFTQAYATSPICNASRAGLMTGSYQQRFGTFWYGGPGMHDPSFPTLAELLSSAGYVTGYIGKFHYGTTRTHVPGERSFPLEHGYQSLYGFSEGRKHYLHHAAAVEESFLKVKREHDRPGQSLRQGPFWVDDTLVDQEGFSTELLGESARAFLEAHRNESFFLTLAFNAVHNFTHQLPADYLREHGLEGYRDWDPATEDYYDWYREGRYPNNPEGRAHYLGQLHYLDLEIGRVLAKLDELGLTEETIVVYVGDNGGSTPIYANNGPLRGSKYTLYEGGTRIPFLVSWPGNFRRGLSDRVVSALDVLPTLCAAVGVAIPAHVDGHDLGSTLRGVDPASGPELGTRVLFWDTGHETAVREGRWKLKTAASNTHAVHEMVSIELGTFLYDLVADPGETRDQAAAHPEVVERLRGLHADWRAGL